MKHRHLLLWISVTSAILSLSLIFLTPNSIAQLTDSINTSHKYYFDSVTGTYKVRAGGGGDRIMVSKYYPTELDIKVGDTVTWYNPTNVPEPHTVTFIMKPTNYPGLMSPYTISNSSGLIPIPQGSNSEPLIVPSGNGTGNVVIAVNARVYFPTVIDSIGKVSTLPPNANYTMSGTEQYVNSGYLLPHGKNMDLPGSSVTFTVKFEKPGNYPYTCIFHPWMTGTIIVK